MVFGQKVALGRTHTGQTPDHRRLRHLSGHRARRRRNPGRPPAPPPGQSV